MAIQNPTPSAFHRRYLFFDYDGTLRSRTYDRIPESTRHALDLLRRKGHLVALATGRAQMDALDLISPTGIDTMVADGGNSITLDGKLIWLEGMPAEPCHRLMRWLDANGWAWAVNVENKRTCITKSGAYQQAIPNPYYSVAIDPGFDIDKLDFISKIFIACPTGEEKNIDFGGVTWARYDQAQVFCEPTDKARGIRKMMELLHAPLEDVIVFGDGTNDLAMFSTEWTSVAMGNAIDELKEKATFVTNSVNDNGIYRACVRLGLIEEGE